MSVSVVIPNHNHGATLELAIASAVCQGPLEVVIVDDASTDDSVEIARQWQAMCGGMVRLVANTTKADNWQEGMAREFPNLKGDTVVFCAADDMLMPGMIGVANRHAAEPVVFTDYACLHGRHSLSHVSQGVQSDTTLSAEAVRQRIQSNASATETGIGSAINWRHLQWLTWLRFWRLGPFGDSIGYAAVAALHGATYVPIVGAAIRVNPQSYGRAVTAEERARLTDEAKAFLWDAGVDTETAAHLIHKRCVQP